MQFKREQFARRNLGDNQDFAEYTNKRDQDTPKQLLKKLEQTVYFDTKYGGAPWP